MLGKLIKYDFRSCWKKFWPVWAAVFVISVINGISLNYCEKYHNYNFLPNTLPKLLLFGVAIAACVIAVLWIYNEFCHGLLGFEGYLKFTLPVKESELIGSKAIVALIMETISAVMVVVCVIMMAFIATPKYIIDMFGDIFRFFAKFEDVGIIIVLFFETIVGFVTTALLMDFHIYTAVSAGHMAKNNRKIVTVIAMVLIFTLTVFLMLNVVAPLTIALNKNAMTWKEDLIGIMNGGAVIIVFELIYTAAMFLFVQFILKNKLNLE